MPSDPIDDLQFAVPEPMGARPADGMVLLPRCAGCGKAITSTYYALRDKVVCPECAAKVNDPPPGLAILRVLKAGVFGLGAGILGAIIWYAVRLIAHAEIGLVAIVVGYLVGKAVRKGSGGRGGLGFQIMAVILTYVCICANYVPDRITFNGHSTEQLTLPLLANAFEFALKFPFEGGTENLIGLLIIGFALWEAWKFNRPGRLALTGPYQVGSTGPTGVIV